MKKIYQLDPWLMPYKDAIDARHERIWQTLKHIAGDGLLKDAVNNHLYYGLHQCKDGSWVIREFATGGGTGVYGGMRFPSIPSIAYRQIKTNNPGYEVHSK